MNGFLVAFGILSAKAHTISTDVGLTMAVASGNRDSGVCEPTVYFSMHPKCSVCPKGPVTQCFRIKSRKAVTLRHSELRGEKLSKPKWAEERNG